MKGRLIGKGRTAEVFEQDGDKVIKLYFSWVSSGAVEYEAKIADAVYSSGVPSPRCYGVVEEDGRRGLVYERVDGPSMLKLIEDAPWKVVGLARAMAGVHAKIHDCCSDNLPSQNERLENAIRDAAGILGDRARIILDYLDSLPKGTKVCHGDFHPGNVLATQRGMLAIDWIDAFCGNQLGDVARTYILITGPSMPPDTSWVMLRLAKILKKVLYQVYLKEYIRLSKVKAQDIDAWILPVAAARLSEKVTGEEKWLLEIIDQKLGALNAAKTM